MAPNLESEKAIAEDLKLRGGRGPVVRLSRNAVVALAGVGGLAVAGVVALGLANRPAKAQPADTYTVGGAPPAALGALPKDYATPQLGPALPGDLGKPIVASQAPPAPGSPQAAAAAQEAQAHAAAEVESARTSKLFVGDVRASASPLIQTAEGVHPAAAEAAALLGSAVDRQTVSADRLTSPPSPYVLQAGTIIPAALVTGIRSDLPGQVIGQVTENVFDSPSGRFLLVPQGSKLLGSYDSQMSAGQSRVLLVWIRLILPNGRSLVLDKLPAGDAEGYGGLQDRVNHHWGAVAGAAALSTLLGVGVELGANNTDNEIVSALRFGAASSLNQAGQQIVGRALTLPPTLTIRPGAPVRVLVNRDLILEPYSA
jgi:type IV secretion system protein VirB10